jgi:hypothetical protein
LILALELVIENDALDVDVALEEARFGVLVGPVDSRSCSSSRSRARPA